jgi:hypothetical protein
MLKHVAKHNDKRTVILFREVPNEGHMCLVAYSDLLPRLVHDEIMKVLESPSGQAAENLADALFRNVMADGRNTLEVLHREGFIKKVPTNQVIVTPGGKSNVRLDELNDILNEMSKGQDAIKRMAELDANAGMTGKRRAQEPREVGAPRNSRATPAAIPTDAVLTDEDLAQQRLDQAQRMRESAKQLLAEAERLASEAAELTPVAKPTKAKKANVKKAKVEAH